MAVLMAPPASSPVDRDDELKAPRDAVRFLTISERTFVMIDGEGAPGPDAFEPRMPGLYSAAYSLHFALKRRGVDERVWPLEGLWWTLDGTTDYRTVMAAPDHGGWRWTLMIALSDQATDAELTAALDAGAAKVAPEFATSLRIERFAEGTAAQIMHFGPYSDEGLTIDRLHAAIADAGIVPRGRHHEIYLGDPRRSAPEKLRTLLRQPV